MKQVREVKTQQRRTSHRESACKSMHLSRYSKRVSSSAIQRGKLLTEMTTNIDQKPLNIEKFAAWFKRWNIPCDKLLIFGLSLGLVYDLAFNS